MNMRTFRSYKVGSVVLAAGIGITAVALLPAPLAGAAGKTVQVGNNTAVVVAPGWSAGKAQAGKLAITHKSPHAVIEVAAFNGVTGTAASSDATNLSQFITGFGLTKVKQSNKQSAQIPGGGQFDSAASITYTGSYQGQKLGGVAVEYQNTTTGDGAFAIVIAEQSDKSKLKKAVNQMFASIANN
jgi:hypothetical protein